MQGGGASPAGPTNLPSERHIDHQQGSPRPPSAPLFVFVIQSSEFSIQSSPHHIRCVPTLQTAVFLLAVIILPTDVLLSKAIPLGSTRLILYSALDVVFHDVPGNAGPADLPSTSSQ